MLGKKDTHPRWMTNAYLLGMVTATAIIGLSSPVLADDSPAPIEAVQPRQGQADKQDEIETRSETVEIKRVVRFTGLAEEDQLPDLVQTSLAHRQVTINHRTHARDESNWHIDSFDELPMPHVAGYSSFTTSLPKLVSVTNIQQFEHPTFVRYFRLPDQPTDNHHQATSKDQGVQTDPVKISDHTPTADSATNTDPVKISDHTPTVDSATNTDPVIMDKPHEMATAATDTNDLVTTSDASVQKDSTGIDEGCGDDSIDLPETASTATDATQTDQPAVKDAAIGDQSVNVTDRGVGDDVIDLADNSNQTTAPVKKDESVMTEEKESVDTGTGDAEVGTSDNATQVMPDQQTTATNTDQPASSNCGVGDDPIEMGVDQASQTDPLPASKDAATATPTITVTDDGSQTDTPATHDQASQTGTSSQATTSTQTAAVSSVDAETMTEEEGTNDCATQTVKPPVTDQGTNTATTVEQGAMTESQPAVSEQGTQTNINPSTATQTTLRETVDRASQTDSLATVDHSSQITTTTTNQPTTPSTAKQPVSSNAKPAAPVKATDKKQIPVADQGPANQAETTTAKITDQPHQRVPQAETVPVAAPKEGDEMNNSHQPATPAGQVNDSLRIHDRFKAAQNTLADLETAPVTVASNEDKVTNTVLPQAGNRTSTLTTLLGLSLTALVGIISLFSFRKKH